MASYKCATILIIAICLCFFHLSSSLDTIIKGKKESPEGIHNSTENIRRVLRSGGSGGHGYSGHDPGGDSSSSTYPWGVVGAGGGNSNHHRKKNSSSICFGSNFLAISLLAVGLSSFAILSKLSW